MIVHIVGGLQGGSSTTSDKLGRVASVPEADELEDHQAFQEIDEWEDCGGAWL